CHNHKFDPISQTDYYALFGILGSCRPGILDANPKEKRQRHQPELRDLKERIRAEVADAWSQAAKNLPERFVQDGQASELVTQAEDRTHPLHPLFLVQRERRKHPDQPFAEVWQSVRSQLPKPIEQSGDEILSWDLADSDANRWYADGNGLTSTGSPAGEFSVHVSGPSIISQVLPGGVYSHVLSTKHRGMFGSPRFHLDQDSDLWLLVAGDGGSQVRYVVQNYPRSGTVYPVRDLNGEQWQWIKYDLTYWTGDDIHVELTTAKDAPILVKENDRSWFGIRRVVLKPKGAAPPEDLQDEFLAQFQTKLLSQQVDSWEGAIDQWSRLLRESIDRWADGAASDADALLLEACRRTGLLPNDVGMGKRLGSKVTEYRRLESEIPLPVRVPGLWEADAKNQPLFVRGNHKQPANDVPRRFLSAFESAPFETLQSGRLQLAEELVSPDNPLVSRVIVNRIWHHLFGEGLVRTPDNFGELGERPTHPELLDALARRFQQHGWSLKRLIRELMLADAWQRSSTPSPLAKARDPENRLLSHAHVRPVEAESLRDAILAISGRLNPESYGPPAGINTEHPRRSVYTTIRRNSMNSFLETFNAPVPFTTKGKRDNTNVPAQSLTLLNAPFVINSARRAASQLKATTKHSKVEWVFLTSLNRPPSATEAKASLDFVDRLTAQYQQLGDQRNQIEEQIAKLEQERREILEPIRLRLCQDRSSTETSLTAALEPIAVWDFEAGPVDSISGKDGQIHGTAKIADGSLHLDGQGHFASPPLNQEIGERTLEAWVQLANLDQRGGGVVSLQNLRGDIFDAIVFGEQSPREWLAGSNVFARTRPFQGSTETKAQERPVHLVLTYSADGTITCYRDGVLYGQPYNPGSLMTFAKGDAQILLGLRHGTPGGNRLLSGKIYEARLYDRALNAEEVAASASGNHLFVSRREILASCSEAQRRRLEELEMKTVQFREQRKTLPASIDDHQPWADLIHAVWNLKEFRYLR
ncbi:MAG: DUF1553 domain-containing protein, partial [Planctomycetaceae bacterium]|nr:DUF1553 domain-containing protein [Planctomycetaceae bacterium]